MFGRESAGTIALPLASELCRFGLGVNSLLGLDRPLGSRLQQVASASVTENLNSIIRDLRPEDEWVWFQSDDHTFEHDALTRMLGIMDDHDLDVLVPLVLKRNPPWIPVLYRALGRVEETSGAPLFETLTQHDIPETGVFEVDAAGSAGMLVRRQVLDDVGDPWFYNTTDQQGRQVVVNEDVTFCTRARDLGYRIHCTPDVVLGHIGIFVVRPVVHPEHNTWVALTEFSTTEDQFRHAHMPIGQTA